MNPRLNAIRHRVDEFLRWWLYELVALMPERVQRRVHLVPERTVIAPEGEGYLVASEDSAGRHPLGMFGATDSDALRRALSNKGAKRELVLELPSADVLVTDVSLPAAAEENLHQVLYYEMDRHTPFTGAQVQFGYRRLQSRTAAGLLALRLGVIPSRTLEGYIEALKAIGVQPQRVQPANDTEIDLTPAKPAETRRLRPSLGGIVASGLALVLILTVAFPLWELNQTQAMLEEEVANIAATAAKARTLSERRDRLEQQAQFIAKRRTQRPAVVAAMDEMAAVLPDDTWIWNFRLDGREVIIRGATPTASNLIGRIERSPMFKGAGFSAPITREEGAERFQITTQLAEAAK